MDPVTLLSILLARIDSVLQGGERAVSLQMVNVTNLWQVRL